MIATTARQRYLGAAQYTAPVTIYLDGPDGGEIEIAAQATVLYERQPGRAGLAVECVEWDDFEIDGRDATETDVSAILKQYGDRKTRTLADYDDDAVAAADERAAAAAEDAAVDAADNRRERW